MREHTQAHTHRRSALGVLVVAIVVGLLLAGCAGQGSPDARTYTVVVPAGTYARPDAGVLDVLEQRFEQDRRVLEFRVGDRLVMVNDDRLVHAIGFISVRPGETVDHVFTTPGEFVGGCTMLGDEEIVVEVRP